MSVHLWEEDIFMFFALLILAVLPKFKHLFLHHTNDVLRSTASGNLKKSNFQTTIFKLEYFQSFMCSSKFIADKFFQRLWGAV